MVTPKNGVVALHQSVTVVGTLSSGGYMSASSVTIASTAGPYHIATWAIDNWGSQGNHASAASVVQYLTYGYGYAKALADCHAYANGCKAVTYVNPNHLYAPSGGCNWQPDGNAYAAASESWFVHQTGYTTSSNRVNGVKTFNCGTSSIWEMNPNSTGLQAWYRNYLQTNADKFDYYFIDDNSMMVVNEGWFPSGGGCSPWPALCHSTQEISDDAAEVRAHANFVNAMYHLNGSPMRFFYQGSSFNNPLDVSAFSTSNRFVGLTCEGCIANSVGSVRPNMYAKVLDSMAAVDASSGAYVLISHGSSPAGSAAQILQRLVTTGIVWLGYSEGHTIVWPDLEDNTANLAVWPEDLIYPSAPLESMVRGATDLEVASGVYRREFASCYQGGLVIGPCATIVNATSSALTIRSAWLSQSYRHAVTLSGGDVLSGGVANIAGSSFTPNSSAVEASGAVLLTP